MKKEGDRDVWRIRAATNMLAAGHEKLRNAIAEIVEAARSNGWVDAGKAEWWLDKLRGGLTLKEGWPRYGMSLTHNRALWVRFSSPNPDSIVQVAQRLRDMGLVEGRHFSVKMPEGGDAGYLYILKEGLAYAAWLSVHGSGRQRELAADFVGYILQRAWEEGEDAYGKAEEIVKEGRSRGSLTLRGFEKEVEVEGKKYVVKVIDGGAELETSESGKLHLRIKITAEVDGVRREYTITYGRCGKINVTMGYAHASAKAPGGREADAERLAAVIKALTSVKPRIRRRSDCTIEAVCGIEHLEGFMRFAELADAVEKWLERV